MRFGNCYTFALARRRRHGGWLVLRRSVKSWVPHMQWAAAGIERGAEPLPSWWVGFRKIMGPDRGYLCWQRGRCVWRHRIHELAIEEYVPPAWADWLLERSALARLIPLHAVFFFGSVRKGRGETRRSAEIIEQTWSRPGNGRQD